MQTVIDRISYARRGLQPRRIRFNPRKAERIAVPPHVELSPPCKPSLIVFPDAERYLADRLTASALREADCQ